MKNPAELLRAAADAIEQRASERDMPNGGRSMARAVAMFNALLGGDRRLSELEGWLFMCCLKMARATAGKLQVDDYVDLAGYAGLAAECASAEGPKEPSRPTKRTFDEQLDMFLDAVFPNRKLLPLSVSADEIRRVTEIFFKAYQQRHGNNGPRT